MPKRQSGAPGRAGGPLRASYLELRLREALRDRVAELLRRAVARPPFAPAFLTEGLRLRAVVLRADDVLRAVVFFRAPPVLRADVLRAVVFRAVVLRAVVLRADDLRAVVFFRAPPVLRAVVLRAAVLRLEPPDLLREDPERELLLDERAEERVVAGTATARAASAPSSIDASPMAESPHVSSATSVPIDVSLGESALDV